MPMLEDIICKLTAVAIGEYREKRERDCVFDGDKEGD
jgi:hypothetical protein